MAANDYPVQRIEAPGVVAQSASIGPRQAERDKEQSPRDRRRRSRRPNIEETLEEEQQALRHDNTVDDKQTHIDYHA